MKTSEFWNAVDTVFGEVLGRSLTADLYLPSCRATAVEALAAGADPEDVWAALVEESGAPEAARWVHRLDPRKIRTEFPR